MKRILLSMLLTVGYYGASAQPEGLKYLRERAQKNMLLLAKSDLIKDQVYIDDKGIHLKSQAYDTRPEFSVYWNDVPIFIKNLENMPFYLLQKSFETKKTNGYYSPETYKEFSHYNPMPTSFQDLFVALDPGHFAGSIDEALQERKYVRMEASEIGRKTDVEFYESELVYMITLILKKKIVEAGGNVMISRPYNTSALGKNFTKWYEEDFEKDLATALDKGDITAKKHGELKAAKAAGNTATVFEDFYKFLDFRARVAKINEFAPNVTMVIHLNADENGKRYGNRYLHPAKDNYSMVFVPGAFVNGELKKTDQKIDFVRLLLSPDLDKSVRLADLILKKQEEILGVKRIPEDRLTYVDKVCIPTDAEGVWARNLYSTRAVRGPIVYTESLYQDNKDMAIELARKDYKFTDVGGQTYQTAPILEKIADSHFQALVEWLEENKRYARN
jgi:N-acetylmuramoyl-L-alanine amidase